MRTRHAAFAAGVLALLAGCASQPPAPEPPALPRITSDYVADTLWYRQPQHTAPGGYVQPGALLHEGRVYHVERPGRILALEPDTGRVLWRAQLPAGPRGEPAEVSTGLGAAPGLVIAGTRRGQVVALDAADGALRWEASLSSEVAAPPVGTESIVVARANDGHIYGLDARSGAERWLQTTVVPPLSLRGAGRPLIDRDEVYAGLANGRLVAMSLASGEVLWEAALGIPEGRSEFERLVDVDADPVKAGAILFAAAYQARFAAVFATSGRIQWSREISVHEAPLVYRDRVFVATEQAEVMALDAGDGAILWRQAALSGRAIRGPVLHDGDLVVADDQGFLHWISPEDGRFTARSQVSGAAIPTAPVVGAEALYVVDAAGAVQALRRTVRGR